MTLPDLSRLSLKSADASEPHEEWLELCGTMPKFTAWRRLRGGKRYIHELADRSENDRFSNGQLVTVYGMTDIDELERPSIEHVWPQSKTDGGRRSAKADWFGFEIVEQRANSARGNRPLVLWPTFNTKPGTNGSLEPCKTAHFYAFLHTSLSTRLELALTRPGSRTPI